jgi:hypothetical protein
MKNQPLLMVDCPLTREGMLYKAVTSKLLRRNISALCQEMKESVKYKLPEKFSLVFDRWTEGTVHHWHHGILHAKKSRPSCYVYASLNATTACWWNKWDNCQQPLAPLIKKCCVNMVRQKWMLCDKLVTNAVSINACHNCSRSHFLVADHTDSA